MVAKPKTSSPASHSPTSDADAPELTNPTPRNSEIAPAGTHRLAPPLAPRPFDFKEAYELTAPDRARLLPTELVVLGPFDIGYAVKVALGSAPRLDRYRDLIAQRFEPELEEIDKIDTYGRSVAHAEVLLAATMTPPDKVQGVYEAALTARRLMMSDLTNLVTQGLLSVEAPKRVRGEAGHTNVARDIQTIATILTESGEDVLERVAIPKDKLMEYQHLAYQLIETSARRNSSGLTSEQARDELDRALTLLINAYSVAEHVMLFLLRKQQIYRQVVPSLYASGNKSKSRKEPDADEEEAAAPAISPVVTAGDAEVFEEAEPAVAGGRGGSPFSSTTK